MTETALLTLNMQGLCHAVAEAAPAPVAAVDGVDHIIRYVNPAFCTLAGKQKDQLLGSAFAQVAPEADECLLLLNRVYRTGHAESHTGRDGSAEHPLFWSYAMSPVLGADERPVGIFIRVTESRSFHQDAVAMNEALLLGSVRQHELTEAGEKLNKQLQTEMSLSRQAQDALIRNEKLASVGRMAAVVAHEINNPLEAVMNSIFLMQGLESLPMEARQYLEIADGELKRIAHITRQTLGFYRESVGPTTFNVASLLDSVLDLLQAKIRSKRAVVEMRCNRRLEMTGISGELRQVFSNLLVNSLDAIDANGMIWLRVTISSHCLQDVRCLRVTIADNGHGIDTATMPHIFEPFFTTKGAIGNGLGLWVSGEIIDKHHGHIRVRSRKSEMRSGTVFTVVLPAPLPAAPSELAS